MKMKNDFRGGLIGVLKNRFVLTGIFGLVWVSFVSEIDLIYLIKSQQELNELKTQVDHYDQKSVKQANSSVHYHLSQLFWSDLLGSNTS